MQRSLRVCSFSLVLLMSLLAGTHAAIPSGSYDRDGPLLLHTKHLGPAFRHFDHANLQPYFLRVSSVGLQLGTCSECQYADSDTRRAFELVNEETLGGEHGWHGVPRLKGRSAQSEGEVQLGGEGQRIVYYHEEKEAWGSLFVYSTDRLGRWLASMNALQDLSFVGPDPSGSCPPSAAASPLCRGRGARSPWASVRKGSCRPLSPWSAMHVCPLLLGATMKLLLAYGRERLRNGALPDCCAKLKALSV
jgi:hypothetical protein